MTPPPTTPPPTTPARSTEITSTTPASARAERVVAGELADVRTEVLRVLRTAGLTLDASGLTTLTAHRGGALSAATLHPDKVPFTAAVDLAVRDLGGERVGTGVQVALEARWPSSAPFPAAAAAAYGQAFVAAFDALDSGLRRFAPRATFDAPTFVGATPGEATLGVAQSGAGAAARLNRMLEGRTAERVAEGDVVLVVGQRAAGLDLGLLYTMTAAGAAIALRPGPLPPAMAAQVGDLTSRLDAALAAADPKLGRVRIPLQERDVPVVEFLHLQARLRAQLPVRTLLVCTTCRLEKIVNPDYQRLQARTRRKNVLSGGLGGMVSMHGVSPFVMVTRLMQLKDAGAEPFVCPRCQGLDADESVITFCPNCGDRRTESALRACAKCEHDFRRDVPAGSLWQQAGPTPARLPPVPDSPASTSPPPPPAAPTPLSPGSGLSAVPVVAAPPQPPSRADVPAPPPSAVPTPPAAPSAGSEADGWSAPTSHGYAQPSAGVSTKGLRGLFGRADPATSTPPPPPAASQPAGWYADPNGQPLWRWWDGSAWTDHVNAGG
ncbi:DUF2510 domain-containing protein [Jatrophihabitans sp. YIM 134969]